MSSKASRNTKLSYLSKYTSSIGKVKKSKKKKRREEDESQKTNMIIQDLDVDVDKSIPVVKDKYSFFHEPDDNEDMIVCGKSFDKKCGKWVDLCGDGNKELKRQNDTIDELSEKENHHDKNRDDGSGILSTEKNNTLRRRRYDSSDDSNSYSSFKKPNIENNNTTRSRRRYDSSDESSSNSSVRDSTPISNDYASSRSKQRRYDSSDDDSSKNPSISSQNESIQKRRRIRHDSSDDDTNTDGIIIERKVKKNKKLSEIDEKELQQGFVQRRTQEELLKEWEQIKNEPFSRGIDDEKLDERLRNVIREGDPMSQLEVKHVTNEFKNSKPIYKGPATKPNRFDIRPGYRWDGIDRGNGFEDKVLGYIYSRAQRREDAYRLRTADM